MKLKRFMACVMAMVLSVSMLSGCDKKETVDDAEGYDVQSVDTGEVSTSAIVDSGIKFDANAKLDLESISTIQIGDTKRLIGKLTVEEFESAGLVDDNGDKAKFTEYGFEGMANGIDVDAHASDGIVDDVYVYSKLYSESSYPNVDIYFTEHKIAVGQSEEVLAKLGMPAEAEKKDGIIYYTEFEYEWEVITDDARYFLKVKTGDGVIVKINAYIL